MRYLHPVSMNESFVASGTYHYHMQNGARLIEESWTIHEFPDGAWMIRVDHDRREQAGASVLIEAWRSPPVDGARIERFDISAFGASTDPLKHVRCTYSFIENTIEVGRSIDGNERQYETVVLPDQYILYPGGWFFAGLVFDFILQNHYDQSLVFFPEWDFAETQAFALKHQVWGFQRLGIAACVVDGIEYTGAEAVAMIPEDRNGPLTGLVDSHGVLLHGENKAGYIKLSRYARRQSASQSS